MTRLIRAAAAAAAALLLFVPAAGSQEFYKDKTVQIVIGSAAGGSYDAYARLVARHLGRHIPGQPTIVPRNMPGAAGTASAAWINNVAPKDGTALGAPLNTIPLTQIMEPEKIGFDSASFEWIGAVASPVNVLVTWHTSGIKTLADAQRQEILIGATTPTGTMESYPLLSNSLFGTKFKVVTGYQGGTEVNIAMERGEVQGRGANSYLSYLFQNADWIRDKKINIVFQMTLTRDPALPDVPTLIEHATTEEQRQTIALLANTETIGRAVMAPPGTPAERVALLRKALMDAVADKGFLADAEKAKLEVQPLSGEEVARLVTGIVRAKPEIVEKYKEAVRSRKS